MPQVGIITEQGYSAGQFGFNEVSEEEKKKLQETEDDKKEEKKK